MLFKPHSQKQEDVLYAPERTVIATTGIQWGKTRSGVIWLKRLIHTHTDPEDNFLVTSPTFKILNQSTFPPFMSLMKGMGKYDGKHDVFRIRGGGTVYFRTGTEPDSVIGITNIRAVLCDEAGKYSKYFWENIQGRSSFYKAPLRIVTSPYSQNWLFKDFIRVKRKNPNALPNVRIIHASSKENPYFPADEYEEKRLTMDPRRFRMMYGGEFEQMEGLVYDCFDETENQCDEFAYPMDMKVYAGIDWGYTEPFSLQVIGILPNQRRFLLSETKKAQLTIKEIGDLCVQKMKVMGIKTFYAGPDQPGHIETLNRLGCPTIGADNDVRKGVDCVYEMLKTRNLKLIRGRCPHTIDELETYHYPEPKDLKPDQDAKDENPVGQNDHALDALRYVCLMTRYLHKTTSPKVPHSRRKPRTEEQEVQRLLKRRA